MNKIVILGSGIAGLAAIDQALKFNKEVNCYTKDNNNTVGGLCASFTVDKFVFDNAIHLSFTKNHIVKNIFSNTPHYLHVPISYNFDRGFWLKHPVQNNLFQLPTQEKIDIINSFVKRNNNKNIESYQDWLVSQYGEVFAKNYPIKYTKKYWTIDPKYIGVEWIGARMNTINLADLLKGAFEEHNQNHYYATKMYYPKQGGYQSFIQPLINKCSSYINYLSEVDEIDTVSKKIRFKNAVETSYDKLISSIPLPELIKAIKNVDLKMLEIATSLTATSIDLISIGFSKSVTNKLWFYIYDEDILASRAYAPHVKSPTNVPLGCSSLQFEIYSSIHSTQKYTIPELIENTIYAIKKMNLANQEDIIFIKHSHIKYGNVIFDLGMEERRDILLSYIRNMNIEPIGRFGLWDYLWSDQAYMSGVNAITKMYQNND